MATLEELLGRYAKSKDPLVREEIVLASVGLVKHIVARLPFVDLPGAEYADLVSHGIVGLLHAVDRFDGDKGAKFETYAASRIKGAVIDALRKQNWMPRDLPRKMRMVDAATSRLEGTLQRHPSDDEIAEELAMDRSTFDQMMHEIGRASMVSLESVIRVERNDDSLPLSEVLDTGETGNPSAEYDVVEGRHILAQALESLPEREKLVLSLYYQDEMTLKEIGAVIGVSESRVCQLHTRALMALRLRLKDVRHSISVS